MLRHVPFLAVFTAAALLRVVTMLGYRPAWLYWGDSFAYLDHALRLRPLWGFQPGGYVFLLWLLRPFHSVTVVVAVQHLLGLGIGLMIYLLLRRHGLPGWGAALATAPPLLDASFLRLEHGVLSDTLFGFLVVAAVTILLWSPVLSVRAAVLAGGLAAGATLTRTIGLPLAALFLVALIVRTMRRRSGPDTKSPGAQRAGLRAVAAMTLAVVAPLGTYAGWYHHYYGRFALAGGDGIALWARTMTFADCRVIDPPADLARLCPNGSRQDAASEYVWAPDSAINRLPGGPGSANTAARSFAVRAIAAQPLDYLGDVVKDTSTAFAWTPVPHPRRVTPAFGFARGRWPLPDRPEIERIRRSYDPAIRGIGSVEPYAGFLIAYQYPAYLRGPMLAALLVLGGLGAAVRRRGGALLPWGTALILLIGPVAVLDFDHRYVLPVIPVACLAAALAARDLMSVRTGEPRRAHLRRTGSLPERLS